MLKTSFCPIPTESARLQPTTQSQPRLLSPCCRSAFNVCRLRFRPKLVRLSLRGSILIF